PYRHSAPQDEVGGVSQEVDDEGGQGEGGGHEDGPADHVGGLGDTRHGVHMSSLSLSPSSSSNAFFTANRAARSSAVASGSSSSISTTIIPSVSKVTWPMARSSPSVTNQTLARS